MDTGQGTQVLNRLVYSVVILTVADGDEINGMPVSWITQVSGDPLLVAVCISPARYSHHMIDSAGCFALNLLSDNQKDMVDRFKLAGDRREKKFEGLTITRGVTGAPIIRECPAHVECRVRDSHAPGDHTLFIGEVVAAGTRSEGPTLDTTTYGKGYTGRA